MPGRMLWMAIFFLLTGAFSSVARADLDVVFVLDTTGSMEGEIREAKERVQQLAEALAKARPKERIRTGVVAYRDRGEEYVTRVSDLTTDVEQTFRFLAGLRADGGGDAPEDVLAGLAAALNEIHWDDARTERQLFLIGDAPAHLEYDGPTPAAIITAALSRRIVVNAIGCRSLPEDGIEFFRRMAYATEGSYQHIGRVRAEEGLADALLHALAPAPADTVRAALPVAAEETERYAVDPSLPRGGVLVRHGAANTGADGCRVTVELPAGRGLAAAPRFGLDGTGLVVELALRQGEGGEQVYRLATCVDPASPIVVRF
jgi:Mg-chelatase subunit ChlD